MICNVLLGKFLYELLKLICLNRVTWFQEEIFNINYSIHQIFLHNLNKLHTAYVFKELIIRILYKWFEQFSSIHKENPNKFYQTG